MASAYRCRWRGLRSGEPSDLGHLQRFSERRGGERIGKRLQAAFVNPDDRAETLAAAEGVAEVQLAQANRPCACGFSARSLTG